MKKSMLLILFTLSLCLCFSTLCFDTFKTEVFAVVCKNGNECKSSNCKIYNSCNSYISTDDKDSLSISKAASSMLIDFDSGTVVYQSNATQKRPIASITKLMTLLVVYDAVNNGKCSMDDDVTVSQNAASMGGSQAFLDANSVHKLKDLVKTIIIASANDSCVAIAEHINGSVEGFVKQMNKKATDLNLTASNFVNCTGLPALNQYSCAADCVKMLAEIIRQNNNFFQYSNIWLEDYTHPDGRITTLTNTNKLSRFYEGCDGGKTGYTNESLHCLCATAKRGETRFIACALGVPDSKTRFAEVSKMFNHGFANYTNNVYLDLEDTQQAKIKNGKINAVTAKPQNKLCFFSAKGEEQNDIKIVYEFYNLKAPIKVGDCVGKAYLTKNELVLSSTNMLSTQDVAKKSFFDVLRQISSLR